MHDKIKQLKRTQFKNKKQYQQALDALPAPEPSLPPFQPIENEPYADNKSKFNQEDVLEQFTELADTTYQFGESLFRKISQSDFFSRGPTDILGGNGEDNGELEMYGDVQEDENGQSDSHRYPFDPDSSSAEPVSVLGDRAASRSNNLQQHQSDAAAPSNDANSSNLRMNTLREKASEKLVNAGKSIWSFFAQATQNNTTQNNSDNQNQTL